MAVSMPSGTLLGAATTVTLTATNATLTDGYNLSFNDKLPAGATLVSATPTPTRTLTDGSGHLVMIRESVADLEAGACFGAREHPRSSGMLSRSRPRSRPARDPCR